MRVKCVSISYPGYVHYGKIGTVVSSIANRSKILFDEDKGKCVSDLTLAYWFLNAELEELDDIL